MPTHIICNFETLAMTPLRLDALTVAEAGYAAIETGAALIRKLRIEDEELHIDDATYPLANRRIFFVGIGKCALAASEAIEHIFGDRLASGIALDVSTKKHPALKTIEAYVGTHPLPTDVNERATKRIIELLSECTENDLVLMLISGGGSALLCLHPSDTMTCVEESNLFTELTARGATIQDINTVRKHTSLARGGGLAKAAYPAEVVSLIISDVPGNAMESIASGPTLKDTSTIADAQSVLAQYHLSQTLSPAFIETPKEQKYFDRVTNFLFLTNRDALIAMQNAATRRGYTATIMSDRLTGEAAAIAQTIAETLHTLPHKTVLLYGGESTVTLKDGKGVGGRNQEMALAALPFLHPDELLISFASDGHDNTGHAGAIADATTTAHAQREKLSSERHLAEHHSYDFFAATGDALLTGYTESNVSDLIIAIKN